MAEALPFSLPKAHFPSPPSLDFPPLSRSRKFLNFSISSSSSAASASRTSIPLPLKPPRTLSSTLPLKTPPPSPDPHPEFKDIMFFLDSIGIDPIRLLSDHPPVVSSSLSDIQATLDLMASMDFSPIDLRRIVGMAPELLTRKPSEILQVFTFLLREAGVQGSDIRRVINRRPRLLACSVEARLRPTLYFLQSIGISAVSKHTSLLSCSVEDKLLPRIEYLENVGFLRHDAVVMVRRFPALFCYSIKDNLEQKFNYFVVEMGRDLRELKEFPQYFSFSLENRIKPRHQSCVEKGVCFPLPVMLKTSELQFHDRLDVCCSSSLPLRNSPLWCTESEIDSL